MNSKTTYGHREGRNFVLVLVGVIVIGLAILMLENHLAATRSAGHQASSTTAGISTTTTTPIWSRQFSVGVVSQTIDEPANPQFGTPRQILTYIRYPVGLQAGTGELADARPDLQDGPYPVVIFSQGFDLSLASYAQLMDAWVQAGFIVVAPEYPYTDPSYPLGVDRSDLVNHARDLNFVISTVVEDSKSVGSVLYELVNTREIAVAGQSDGGDVSVTSAFNTCCQDSAIKAAMILSGAEYASFGGKYFTGTSSLPLLVTQGTQDTINPPECSVEIYNQALAPKDYLELIGADHLAPYTQSGQYLSITEQVTTDFLKEYLLGDTFAQGQMTVAGNQPGFSTLTVNGSVAQVPGGCPGAPGF